MELKLTATRQAMAEYFRTAPERTTLMEEVKSQEDVRRWVAAEEEALRVVRLAFYEDTKDRNSLTNCMLVDLATLVRWLALEDTDGQG